MSPQTTNPAQHHSQTRQIPSLLKGIPKSIHAHLPHRVSMATPPKPARSRTRSKSVRSLYTLDRISIRSIPSVSRGDPTH
ncbi:hypothetical protein CEXT_660881 [Caerostris extrusa]|uniref:Uncharacterized protein n=1 Tax=Caerostris extrusa TaxID=172846 RepID=A0AAV4MWZ5_CAEEX|nr:hypothetical protein CEXT_660881 [Caerostris extrusa]